MKTALLLLIGVLVLLSSALAATTYPLADRLPDNTTFYVGWAGRSEVFDNSAMGKLLEEPQVRQLVEALRVNVLAKASAKNKAAAEHLWAMAELAAAHPIALGAALSGESVESASQPAGAPATAPAKADPRLAIASRAYLLARLQGDKEAFAEHLNVVLALVPEGHKAGQTRGTVSYQVISGDENGPALAVGFVGDVFFACEAKMAPALIDRLGGKGGSLADKPGFVEALRAVSGENVQVAVYADVTSIAAMVEKLAGPRVAEAKGKVTMLGLNKITAVAGCGCLEDGMAHGRLKVFTLAPHQGVLMLLAGKPLDGAALSDVPADADLVASVRLDPLAVYEELERVLAAADSNASQRLEMAVTGAGTMLGIDLKADLLASLGDEWTLMTAASNGGFLSGTVLVCQLRDAPRFVQTQNELEAYAKNVLGQADQPATASKPASATTRPAKAKAAKPKRFELRTTKMGDVDIHYVWMPGRQLPIAPAWAVVDGKLYIAAWPQVVAGVLENRTPRLLETAEFRAMRGKLSPSANMLLYINDGQLLRQFYGVLVGGGTMLMSKAAPDLADVLRPEMIPSLPTLLKYVKPELRSVSADDKGIIFEAYGTLAGPTALAPIAAPVLLISLNKATDQARTVYAQNWMMIVSKGLAQYVVEHGSRLPDTLAGILPLPSASAHLKEVDYVGKGIDIHDPNVVKQPVVIAYKNLPSQGSQCLVAVVYSDGRTGTVSEAKLQEELARTRQAAKGAASQPAAPAEQADTAKDMMELGKAVPVYVSQHGSRLPDTVDALAPAGKTMPKGIAYVGKGIDVSGLAQPVVIAYERLPGPGPHRMSAVLFSDSHVVVINEGKLQEELALTHQAAAKWAASQPVVPARAR